MSGVKRATVQNKVSRTMTLIRQGLSALEAATEAIREVGRKNCEQKLEEAREIHVGVTRKLPQDLAQFVKSEVEIWQSLIREHDAAYEDGEQMFVSAQAKERMFEDGKASADRRLSQIERRVEELKGKIQWRSGYLDSEDREADDLRTKATSVFGEVQTSTGLVQDAQAERRMGFTAFAQAQKLAQDAEREYDRLVRLAQGRQERQRIAEENKRTALTLSEDILSLRQAIERKNVAKFGAQLYSAEVQAEIEAVQAAISRGAYKDSIPRAQALKARLTDVANEIDKAERVWVAQKVAAEKALSDAEEELATVNRADLESYAGVSFGEIDAAFAAIDRATDEIKDESFVAAEQKIGEALANLRAWSKQAVANKQLVEQRQSVAESIMQVLYDSGYDNPECYPEMDGDQLSDCCIVAGAPSGTGNIKMNIGLTCDCKFEVDVPEGHERLCVEVVKGVQDRLQEEGLDFVMTDWGRAADQGKVHLDVRQKTKEKEVEVTKMRQD